MLKMKLSILCLVYFFVAVKAQRIAGGSDVAISQYPFAASLLRSTGTGATSQYAYACGGSILTANAILSAASCFFTNGVAIQASSWSARVGSSSPTSGGTIYLIRTVTNHPSFLTTTKVNDISVIRTTLAIEWTVNVQPARIAGTAYTFATNQEIVAIGWGEASEQTPGPSDQLRSVQIWTINQQTCANRYRAQGFTVTENMVCVGWHDVGIRGQCQGDFGSPILDRDGGVVGVFSHTEGCANPWFPDINTRVAPYTNWIITTATAALT